MQYISSRRWERRRHRGNWFVRLLTALWTPIGSNGLFFFFIYLLGLACILIENTNKGQSAIELFFDVYLLCAVLCIFPQKIRRGVKYVVSIFLYSLAMVDVWCFSNLGSGITPVLVSDVVNTNTREAGEALQNFLTFRSFFSPVLIIVALGGLHIFFTFRHFIWPRLNVSDAVLGGVTGLLLIGSAVVSLPGKKAYLAGDGTEAYIPLYRLWVAPDSAHQGRKAVAKAGKANAEVTIDSCSHLSPDIVVIIGESYNKHHSQLYGYTKPTTPWQRAAARDGSLIPFSDVISPANQTLDVFRYLLSTFSLDAEGKWEDYPLVLNLLRKGGYQVTFITNQFVEGATADASKTDGSAFFNDKELSQLQFDHRNTRMRKYDLALLHDLDSLRAFSKWNNVYVIHLLGQHFKYQDRYPQKAAQFRVSDYRDRNLTPENKAILAAYDNATAYNDYVVHQIVRRFVQRDAVVIYVPDHGELCFDGSNTSGRTLELKTRNDLYQQVEIPFWIWTSQAYRKARPWMWRRMWDARNKPYMTDNFDQLLMSLAGLHSKWYRPQDDLLNPQYKVRHRRVGGKLDYDAMMKQ